MAMKTEHSAGQANIITTVEKTHWNTFAKQWPAFSIMQSYEWGAFKQAQGWQVIRVGVEKDGQILAGAQMLIKSLPTGIGSIAYIPRGPLLDWTDTDTVHLMFDALHEEAGRHNAISLKIEPSIEYTPENIQLLESHNFKRSDFNNQPQCSMLIDLSPDHETLLQNMHKTTRYNVRYSARKGVEVREATLADIDIFYALLKGTAERAGFPARSKDYYYEEWKILAGADSLICFLALYEDEVLAMRMPAAFGHYAATLHSGSSGAHSKLKPNELLMWECIKWAKERGCKIYDVWGIPDAVGENIYLGTPLPEDQTEGLWGVYQFKSGFGGEVIYYVGAYDFVYSRLWYGLMNTAMTQMGSLEKLAQLGDRLLSPGHAGGN